MTDRIPLLVSGTSIATTIIVIAIALQTASVIKRFSEVDPNCTNDLKKNWEQSLKIMSVLVGFLAGSLLTLWIETTRVRMVQDILIYAQSIAGIMVCIYMYNNITKSFDGKCEAEEVLSPEVEYFLTFCTAIVAGVFSRPIFKKIGGSPMLYSIMSVLLGISGILLAYSSIGLTENVINCVYEGLDDDKSIKMKEEEMEEKIGGFKKSGLILVALIVVSLVVIARSASKR
tara:strand:+ start:445 stop:1134 length:690 start_codon:yes stop_codon:yes gene_type:complete